MAQKKGKKLRKLNEIYGEDGKYNLNLGGQYDKFGYLL